MSPSNLATSKLLRLGAKRTKESLRRIPRFSLSPFRFNSTRVFESIVQSQPRLPIGFLCASNVLQLVDERLS